MRLLLQCALMLAAGRFAFAVDPLFFYEQNIGQEDAAVLFRIQGVSQPAYLTGNAFVINPPLAFSVLTMRFADGAPATQSLEKWPGILNRFTGSDPAKWLRGIPAQRRLQYTAIQPNVDAIFGESDTAPTLTFSVKPGGDPSALFLEAAIFTHSSVDPQTGAWTGNVTLGSWMIAKPRAWQQQGDTQNPVDVQFRLISDQRAAFSFGSYDHARTLFVEITLPISIVSRNYQGPRDAAGNTYFEINSDSTTVCFINTGGGRALCPDAAAGAIRATGEPIFLSILAGRFEDSALGGAVVDGAGNVVMAGNTGSDDFPITRDAYQKTNAGRLGPLRQYGPEYINGDLFLSVISPADGDLLYSTFIGGPDPDYPSGILGGPGSTVTIQAFVFGTSFPTTPGAWMTSPAPTPVVPITSNGNVLIQFDTGARRLRFATFHPYGLTMRAVGADSSVYMTGATEVGAVTTPGSLQPQFGGGSIDGYLVRLAPDGAGPIFATYYGGPLQDALSNVVLDQQGNLWVEGQSSAGCSHCGYSERDRHVLLHLRSDGSALLAEPISLPYWGNTFRLAQDGNLLYYADPASFHPVRAGCGTRGVQYLQAFAPDGFLQLAAHLPPTSATNLNQIYSDTLVRYRQPSPTTPSLVYASGAAYRGNYCHVSPGEIVSLFGFGLGPEAGVAAAPGQDAVFPSSLAGVRVLVDDMPAPLLYVQSWQINAVVPYSTVPGKPVTITVDYQGKQASITLDAVVAGFSLFAYGAEGAGAAAAINEDETLNSELNPAARGSIVVVYGTGGGATSPPSTDGGLTPIVAPELLPKPAGKPVVQLLGSYNAEVLYSGAAPALINGLTQVNFRIPADLPLPGTVAVPLPVDIAVGGAASENTAKIWVK